jgi:RNA polymerase sigma-70 factor (ECF subfamily)
MAMLAERQDRRNLELLPDAELIRRVCAGEVALFELIMRRHNRRLFRLARSILGNDADAEEIVQESYVNAYFKLKQFRGPEGFASWLARIATNEALMRRRRQKRGALVVPGDFESTESPLPGIAAMDPQSSADDPESDLYAMQLQRLLERAVNGLPDAYRATFVMREIEQLSAAETAQALNIEEATVKTRLHRARRLLQQQLTGELRAALGGIYQFDGMRCDRIIARVFARIAGLSA